MSQENNTVTALASQALRHLQAPVAFDTDGVAMQRFGLSYRHEGRFWALSFWAYGWSDAESRLAAIREALTIDGEIVAEVDL